MIGKTQTNLAHSNRAFATVILHAIFFLFFLQLLTDFVAAVYAFGLLGTSIPPEIVSVLFLFSPIVLLAFRRGLPSSLLLGAGRLFLLCRVLETLLDTRGRMLTAGLGVAIYLILLPAMLWEDSLREEKYGWLPAGQGLVMAVLLSFGLRAYHSGVDLSTDGPGRVVGWLLVLIGAIYWVRYWPTGRTASEPAPAEGAVAPTIGFGRLALLCLGMLSCLVLLYFGFSAPNVLARWMGLSYAGILTVLSLVYVAAGLMMAFRPGWILQLNGGQGSILNLAFVIALVGAILSAQVAFPADPDAYPFYATPLPQLGLILFWIALILSPVIFINFSRFWSEIISNQPGPRALAGGFAISSLFLLVMIFAHVFTTVYDYIPVVGPFFRDKFWLVYFLAAAGMFLPSLRPIRRLDGLAQPALPTQHLPASSGLMVLLLGAAAVMGLLFGRLKAPIVEPITALKVLTYNIQQGYSESGQKNFDGQLAVIRSLNPDLVGLEESDTNRIAGGNADLVRYLADGLGYYSYYGPSTVSGTFGIALLSRYPILEPNTFYMYSEREQTAAIQARISGGNRSYNIFVTHLGNGGPLIQQQAVLSQVESLPDMVLMGDFNFRPDTEAYRLTTQQLSDSWLHVWPDGVDGSGIDPARRIDYIFVSSGMKIETSQFLLDPASDHPALMTILGN